MTCTCATNADGVYLCNECCTSFEEFLCGVGDVVDDLTRVISDVNLTAQYGGSLPGPTKLNADLPFNVDAFDKREAIHRYLVQACTRIAMDTGDKFTLTVQGLTDYLFAHVDHLRKRSWGPEVVHELGKVVGAGKNVLEVGGERINVGRCGYVFNDVACPEPLNPYRTQDTIKCRTCGTVWDIGERQRDAIGGAWNAIAYPPVIIRSLAAYGVKIKPKHFENWVALGHLEPVGEVAGRKQYRVSDVWAVANRMHARKRKVA